MNDGYRELPRVCLNSVLLASLHGDGMQKSLGHMDGSTFWSEAAQAQATAGD